MNFSQEKRIEPSLDPNIWFPSFWFFLRNVAHTYPDFPNDVAKRKYYDFIQNLPLFIPNKKWSVEFSHLLDEFPISPYLANRDSFFFWIHFIQNRVDRKVGNPENTLFGHMEAYYQQYKPVQIVLSKKIGIQKKYILLTVIILCMFFIACIYAFSNG